MAHSNTLYQPTLLELAQDGNCRALTYWMNSLLHPQGVQIQVQPAPDQFLKILIDFRRPRRREACLHLRERIVRFICYRLWTLNSAVIQGVRIVARQAGDSRVLWQMSVRINSPAVAKLRRVASRQHRASRQFRFQVIRSLFISSITLAGFWLGYRLFYLELGRWAKEKPVEDLSLTHRGVELPDGQILRMPLPPSQTNFTVPESAAGTVLSQVTLPSSEKLIALTFDSGPDPEVTPQILDILQQYDVRATFFMSGISVDRQPDLARRIVAEGHAVGNRGWNWLSETDQNADVEHEVDDTAQLIEKTTGAKTALFRPSTGRISSPLVAHAKRKNNAVILWSVDAQDRLVAAPILLDNVLRNAQPGRIVLLHDGPGNGTLSPTVQALPQLITGLQNQGYRFATVPKLLQQQLLPEGSPSAAPSPASTSPTATPSLPDQPAPLAPAQSAPAQPAPVQPTPAQPTPDKAGSPVQSLLRKRAVALAPAVF